MINAEIQTMHLRAQPKTRTVLGWFIIAAIVLRGVIPVGYMPDFSAASGIPKIAICGGHTHHDGTPSQDRNDPPCPFNVNASFSFAGVQPPVFAALIVFFAIVPMAAGLNLAPQRIYGNASPRAPPVLV